MKNNLRQKILNELKFLLKEEVTSGTPLEEIGKNLADSDVIGVYYTGVNKYSYLNATNFFGNVTEEELRDYINSGAPNANANTKICTNAGGLVVIDGVGQYADHLMFVKCSNNKPTSLTRGMRATNIPQIKEAIKYFIEKQIIADKNAAASANTTTSAITPATTSTAPKGPAPSLSCRRCVGLGKGCQENKDIRELQNILARLKFMNQSESGFGEATEAAVKAFQTARKLKVDGIVGRQTCLALGLIRKAAAAPKSGVAQTPVDGSRGQQEDQDDEYKSIPKRIEEAKILFDKLIKEYTK